MSYTPTLWENGDLISPEKLNKIEQGIEEANGSQLPEITAEDEGKVLTVVDGAWGKGKAAGGADWEAEEGEDGYIANKPFYVTEGIVEIASFTNLQFSNGASGVSYTTDASNINEDYEYVVKIGDEEYICKYFFQQDAQAGRYAFISNPENIYDCVGFAGTLLNGKAVIDYIGYFNNNVTCDVSITVNKEIVKKLDAKYIPDDVVLKNIKDAENGGVIEGYNTVASGDGSHAEGVWTTASGYASHTEGHSTTASNNCSHAEGDETTASSTCSHAEGLRTVASGAASHAEGWSTTASGDYSHAEGENTIAKHKSQHVFGEFNIEDSSSANTGSRGNYVEIVGNGTFTNLRSNARTLDWSGNETLAGSISSGGSLTLGKGTNDEVTLSAATLKQLIALLGN